jgi:hypothetical protein
LYGFIVKNSAAQEVRVSTSERREWWGKETGGWIWCKICVNMYVSAKMIPVEAMSGIGRGGDKGEY